MPQPAPGHVGDVQQPIHPIEIDECAEVSDVFHCASYSVAHVHAFHEFQALFASLLLDYLAPAEHDVFRSMNAAKSVMFFTVPVTRSPTFTPSMNFRRFSLRSFSITSRRLSTTFLRSSLSLTILKSYVLPTNCCKSFGG